jgi:hypothetical protein
MDKHISTRAGVNSLVSTSAWSSPRGMRADDILPTGLRLLLLWLQVAS